MRGVVAWRYTRIKFPIRQILSTPPHICAVFLYLALPASAQDLIRCPDWRSLVAPAVLRTASDRAAPGEFDAKLQQARAAESRNVSPRPTGSVAGGDDGRRHPRGDVACTYTIRSGDTYGAIAARHLRTSKRWPELARANPGVDPTRLRVGAVINLPCTGGAAQAKKQAAPSSKPGAPLAGTGFLARLSGQTGPAAVNTGKKAGSGGGATRTTAAAHSKTKKTGTGAKTKAAGKTQAKAQAAAPAKPPAPPPLPVWTARAGEDFEVVLNRWGKAAGYRVVVGTTDAWTISVPVRIQSNFESAVGQLVRGLGSDGKAPPVRIYRNRVVRLGGVP